MSETSDFARKVYEHDMLVLKQEAQAREAAAREERDRQERRRRIAAIQEARVRRNDLFIGTNPSLFWNPEELQTAQDFLRLMAMRDFPNSHALFGTKARYGIAKSMTKDPGEEDFGITVGYLIGVAPSTADPEYNKRAAGQADDAYLCADGLLRVGVENTSCLYDDDQGSPIAPIIGTFDYEKEPNNRRVYIHRSAWGGGSLNRIYEDYVRTIMPQGLEDVLLGLATATASPDYPKQKEVFIREESICD